MTPIGVVVQPVLVDCCVRLLHPSLDTGNLVLADDLRCQTDLKLVKVVRTVRVSVTVPVTEGLLAIFERDVFVGTVVPVPSRDPETHQIRA